MSKRNELYINAVNELVKDLKPVSLSEMDCVKLMDRTDSKFVLSFDSLLPVLKQLPNQYRILTINKIRIFNYRTDYFDTPELSMYTDHHNGKLNRFKIRQREYVESNIRFLEVKYKSNKGRVIKDRIEKSFRDQPAFTGFVTGHTPYDPRQLSVILTNRFNRITLVNLKLKERVTLDFNLSFSDEKQNAELSGLVIIEIKQNRLNMQSPVFKMLKEYGVRRESISKYCLGVSVLNRHHKLNNFKKTVNLINQLSHVEISA
jgi:hypothetical protein